MIIGAYGPRRFIARCELLEAELEAELEPELVTREFPDSARIPIVARIPSRVGMPC